MHVSDLALKFYEMCEKVCTEAIMDAEEQEAQKIRLSARDALDRVSGEGKVCTCVLVAYKGTCRCSPCINTL